MPLIPLFNEYPREKMIEEWNLEFPLSEWVSISFDFEKVKCLDGNLETDIYENGDEVSYETNRYDVKYYDAKEGRLLSIYVYMDESSTKVIAVDEVVKDDDNVRYPIEETPFGYMLGIVKETKTN